MKWLMLIPYTGLWLLLACAGLWSSTIHSSAVIPSTGIRESADSQTPLTGWKACEDLGTGTVPGVPGVYQRFVLCQGKEWRAWTFLLEAGNPTLAAGADCIRKGEANYRCGQPELSLRQYQFAHLSSSQPAAGQPAVKPAASSGYKQANISAHSASAASSFPTGNRSTHPGAAADILLYSLGILTVGLGWFFYARQTHQRLS